MQISINANFHFSFSFGIHYNALFVLIMISNKRSKRVNENIIRRLSKMKPLYMPIFMIVDASVFEFQ